MGWRIRNGQSDERPASSTHDRLNTPIMDSQNLNYNTQENGSINRADCQIFRRRRCGIQHGFSGRTNSTAILPLFRDGADGFQLTDLVPMQQWYTGTKVNSTERICKFVRRKLINIDSTLSFDELNNMRCSGRNYKRKSRYQSVAHFIMYSNNLRARIRYLNRSTHCLMPIIKQLMKRYANANISEAIRV